MFTTPEDTRKYANGNYEDELGGAIEMVSDILGEANSFPVCEPIPDMYAAVFFRFEDEIKAAAKEAGWGYLNVKKDEKTGMFYLDAYDEIYWPDRPEDCPFFNNNKGLL